eukprot:6473294-Amphidinium_carterae.1
MVTMLATIKNQIETPRPLSSLNVEERALAGQVFYCLAMLCRDGALQQLRLCETGNGFEAYRQLLKRYDPQNNTRGLARLARCINPSFAADDLSKLLDSIVAWEKDVLLCEQISGAALAEPVKCAVLVEKAPEEVKTYLLIHCGSEQRYPYVRAKLEEYIHARSGPAPMELGAVWGHDKGKGKGEQKGDKYSKGKAKGKDKGTGKSKDPKGAGKNKEGGKEGKPAKRFTGTCHNCGKVGHMARNSIHKKKWCSSRWRHRDRPTATTATDSSTSAAAAAAAIFGRDHEVCSTIAHVGGMDFVPIVVDSGAVTSVCGPDHFPEVPLMAGHRVLHSAQGSALRVQGLKRVCFSTTQGIQLTVVFTVCDVVRPLLSVHQVCQSGVSVLLEKGGSYCTLGGIHELLVPKGALYELYVRVLDHGVHGIGESKAVPEGMSLEGAAQGQAERVLDENHREGESAAKSTVVVKLGAAEVEHHELTHIPYAPWCSTCVAG